MQEETRNLPRVRIVAEGIDVSIDIQGIEDIEIAHQAIDLGLKRYVKRNQPTCSNPDDLIERMQFKEGNHVTHQE